MSKNITFKTYNKIKDYFSKNPDKEFNATNIRDELNCDYESVKSAINMLLKANFLKRVSVKGIEKYKLKGE